MKTLRRYAFIAVGWASCLMQPCLASDGFIGELSFVTGDLAPGTGSGPISSFKKFLSFDSPHRNNRGDVAFIGVLENDVPDRRGIWLKSADGSGTQLIVSDGDLAPPFPGPSFGSSPYKSIELLGLDDSGRIFFTSENIPRSKFAIRQGAVFLWDPANGGSFKIILSSGYPAYGRSVSEGVYSITDPNGNPYNFGRVHRIQISPSGEVSFVADYGVISPYEAGVGMWKIGETGLADPSSTYPEPVFLTADHPEVTAGLAEIIVDTGTEMNMEAWMVLPDQTTLGDEKLYSLASGDSAPEQSVGDPASDLVGSNFTYLGRPAASTTGQMAFWGETDSSENPEGIWLGQQSSYRLLAASGNMIGNGEVISALSDPVINESGLVGFKAEYEGGGEAIWLGSSSSSLVAAAELGVTPTGRTGSRFLSFGNPILNDRGQVLFSGLIADDIEERFGYWAMTSVGCVIPILVVGDELSMNPINPQDTVTIERLSVSDLTATGLVALVVEFDNGDSALVSVQVEPEAPQGYAEWSEIWITDPADRDPSVDLDSDGRNNLAEFAFGTDPLLDDFPPSGIFEQDFVVGDGGDSYLQLSARVRSGVSADVIYEIEQSNDLVTWFGDSQLVQIQSTPDEGGFDRLIFRQLTPVSDDARRYSRLRVVPGSE